MIGDRVTIRDVIKACSRITSFSEQCLVGKSRARCLMNPRSAIYVFAKNNLGKSLSQIGSVMRRDHSTILHHMQTRGADPSVLTLVDKIARAIERKGRGKDDVTKLYPEL